MLGISQVSVQNARSLRRNCRACVLAWAVFLAVGVADVHAKETVPVVQSAHLWSNTTSLSLGFRYNQPLGTNQFPDKGISERKPVRDWLFTGMIGAGVAVPNSGADSADLTLVGNAGFMKRAKLGLIDEIGLVVYANLGPQAIGPAVMLRNKWGPELMVGGLRVEGGDFVLALGLNLPLALITDTFGR